MAQPIVLAEFLPSLIPVVMPMPLLILVGKPMQMYVIIPMLLSISLGLRENTQCPNLSYFNAHTLKYVYASETNCVQFWRSNHTVSLKTNVPIRWRTTPKFSLKNKKNYETLVSHSKLWTIAHTFLAKIS